MHATVAGNHGLEVRPIHSSLTMGPNGTELHMHTLTVGDMQAVDHETKRGKNDQWGCNTV